jgi:acyl carrier protein
MKDTENKLLSIIKLFKIKENITENDLYDIYYNHIALSAVYMVYLVLEIEKEFDFSFSSEDLSMCNLASLDDVIKVIERRRTHAD